MERKLKELPFKKESNRNGNLNVRSKYPPVSSDEENHPPTANLSFQRQIGRKIANKTKLNDTGKGKKPRERYRI
nr:unnamed protein product [Callosobruchus analis]